jgi:hypothetical protein
MEVATMQMGQGCIRPMANLINQDPGKDLSARCANDTVGSGLASGMYSIRQSNLSQRP